MKAIARIKVSNELLQIGCSS